MKTKLPRIALAFFIFLSLFFFYPILKGQIPFPGDLLVGSYAPYTSYSYIGYAPGGVPNKAQGPDVIKEMYPWKLFSIDQLKHWHIPFWNPYNFSGNPLMANFQSNVFYPLNGIFFLLPFMHAWTLYIFLTPVLSGWFLYLYLKHKKLETTAALFGGAVFAFSSYMVVWMEYGNIGHTLLWLPLGLLFIDLFFETKRLRYPMLLVLILCISFLAGYIQGFFYEVGILFLYTWLFFKKEEKTGVFFLLSLFVFPLLLGAFQFLPTLALFGNSSRGGYTLSQIQYLLNPSWYMVTLVVPDFFGNPATRNMWFNGTYIERVSSIGLIPLFFAISTLFQKKSKETVLFSILAVLSLLLTTDLLITKYLYLIPIPVISTTVPTRMLSVFVFSASILSAFGLHNLLTQKKKYPLIISAGIIAIILGGGWVFVLSQKLLIHTLDPQMVLTTLKNLTISSGIFFIGGMSMLAWYLIPHKKLAMGFLMLLFVVSVFDAFRFFQRITPFSPPDFVYPKTPVVAYLQKNQGVYRSWGYDQGLIESNFQTADKVFSPEGNDPLHNKQYTEFIMSSKDGKVPTIPARPDANIFNSNTDTELLHNIYRQKVLNIMGVKYVLSKDTSLGKDFRTNNQRFDPQTYSLVWQETPWQVYENKNVVPRVFFTSRYIVTPSKQENLGTIFSSAFDEKNVITLEKPGPYPSDSEGSGSVTLSSYSPNTIVLKVRATRPGYVFLSDVFTPNWQAYIDGKKSTVLRADYAFRTVPVPSGMHTLTFSYEDQAFFKGVVVSLVSIIILIGYFSFFRYYKKWQL
jgi:hypothetical protein